EGARVALAKEGAESIQVKWNQPFALQGNQLVLQAQGNATGNGKSYLFTYKPAGSAAREILSGLVASPYSSKTSIIKLELKGSNVAKCSAILDALVSTYNDESLLEQNLVLNKTIEFINQRLSFVTQELGEVEDGLRDFKVANKLVDIESQAGTALGVQNALEQEYVNFGVREQLFTLLSQQIKKLPQAGYGIIPATVLGDEKVNFSSIEAYNQLVLKRLRDEPSLGKNSPLLADLSRQIQTAYQAVLQSLNDYESALRIEKASLQQRMRQYDAMIGQVPGKEKSFVEIKRQQGVKEALYLYLLQKREESAIATSSTQGMYQLLEPASGSTVPIEPNSQRVLLFCLVAGLLVPIGLIYVKDLFDDKLRNREHITKVTKAPIVAEVGHIDNLENNLVVADKSRNIIAEQFRILRTNLSYLLQDKSTVLVTSTVSGEGKSFIALNLAAVLAISGKRVALLEFDLRKPRIIKNVGLEKRAQGLSNFLARQVDSIDNLHYTLDKYPSLHIYGCGPIPPNPAELMIGERMQELFTQLKARYDYVVIDSAPVGLVSDAYSL
ncbi:MAG: GumC family protein, partial [Sphingomonadales bacterium]